MYGQYSEVSMTFYDPGFDRVSSLVLEIRIQGFLGQLSQIFLSNRSIRCCFTEIILGRQKVFMEGMCCKCYNIYMDYSAAFGVLAMYTDPSFSLWTKHFLRIPTAPASDPLGAFRVACRPDPSSNQIPLKKYAGAPSTPRKSRKRARHSPIEMFQ